MHLSYRHTYCIEVLYDRCLSDNIMSTMQQHSWWLLSQYILVPPYSYEIGRVGLPVYELEGSELIIIILEEGWVSHL